MKHLIKNIKNWLGISALEHRIRTLENLLYHQESKKNGFAVLKRHLNRPDEELPRFMGKEIEQD